jgi:DNA polymerase-3 subunit alpha
MCNKNKDFVHLHAHTHFSVQDALPSPTQYAKKLSEMGFRAGAITDHGRISGAIEFVSACRKESTEQNRIKPILGCEFYTYHDRFDKNPVVIDGKKRRPKHNHLTLLAQNETGYRNLLKMASIGAEEGYYYEPTIDRDVLSRHSEGVIALSGCMGSEVSQLLLRGEKDKALKVAEWFKGQYQDNYYIEMHYHGIEEQKSVLIPGLFEIARKLDLPMVCANDVHYLEQEDWKVHKLHISMRDQDKDNSVSGKFQAYQTKNFHLKTYDEMEKIFGSKIPEALTNTVLLSESVEDFMKLGVPHLLPRVIIPENDERFNRFRSKYYPYHKPNEAYLAYLSFDGLAKLGHASKKNYIERLRYEIDTICWMGVTDYFLIEREMANYMKTESILYGIRGSGVGSLVNYCLQVCTVDPLRWNLMFERFLNPGRGQQYKVEVSDLPVDHWREQGTSTDLHIANNELRKKMEVVANENPEYAPQIFKELWVLENQGLSNYIIDVANKGIKSKDNDCQLWTAWALGITDKKPESDLVVSRIAELPDVDTDVDKHKREKVIDWMRNRFGNDKCSQIGTWGTYQAKAAVMGSLKVSASFQAKHGDQTHYRAQDISKSIPSRPGITIDEALEESPEFASYASKWPEEIRIAKKLVGVIQNFGVHAAGVLLASEPISEHAPLENSKGVLASGYDMGNVVHVGLTKYDVLGLATFTMIALCFDMIESRHGAEKIPNFIKLLEGNEDPKVLRLFTEGKTDSVFQFASAGMKKALREVKADCIEDLIAINALFRPGPLQFIPNYATGKKNPNSVKYSHPIIKDILGVTYGIPVYQEQAMELGRKMASFNHNDVDKLRKAVSKKMPKEFAEICEKFRKGATKNNIQSAAIEEVLERLQGFAGYAFNRSHACAYSLLAYSTAYLRTYFPSEWLAACMQCDRDDEDKMAVYRRECAAEGIHVKTPNVNESGLSVTVNKRGDILLPLNSVKGVGDSSKSIVDNQPYEDLDDLATRARPNRGMIESLAHANALDCFAGIKNKSVEQIMEMWDASVDRRNQQEKDAKKAAKLRYKVISPMEQMLSGDDDNLFGFENTIPKRNRDVKKVRMKSLDLFPDDLL